MGFVTRKDRVNDPALKQFVELFQQSQAVRNTIADRFDHNPHLYTLPWQGSSTASK